MDFFSSDQKLQRFWNIQPWTPLLFNMREPCNIQSIIQSMDVLCVWSTLFFSQSHRVDGPGGHQAVMFSWKLQSYKSLFVNRLCKNAVKELHRLYFWISFAPLNVWIFHLFLYPSLMFLWTDAARHALEWTWRIHQSKSMKKNRDSILHESPSGNPAIVLM